MKLLVTSLSILLILFIFLRLCSVTKEPFISTVDTIREDPDMKSEDLKKISRIGHYILHGTSL